MKHLHNIKFKSLLLTIALVLITCALFAGNSFGQKVNKSNLWYGGDEGIESSPGRERT